MVLAGKDYKRSHKSDGRALTPSPPLGGEGRGEEAVLSDRIYEMSSSPAFEVGSSVLRIQPIFYQQTGHVLEVRNVARKQQGVVHQTNQRYLQIHCSYSEPVGTELLEHPGGCLIKWKDCQLIQCFDTVLKSFVAVNLIATCFLPIDESQPPLNDLLHTNNRNKDICSTVSMRRFALRPSAESLVNSV